MKTGSSDEAAISARSRADVGKTSGRKNGRFAEKYASDGEKTDGINGRKTEKRREAGKTERTAATVGVILTFSVVFANGNFERAFDAVPRS